MKNWIISLRIILLSVIICFQALGASKEEQENLARKQNLDKQVAILKKLEEPLANFLNGMNHGPSGQDQLRLRHSLKNDLNNLKKELEPALISLFPGKSWNNFVIIQTKEAADSLLKDVQKKKNELLTQIQAIPLTEEQKNAEIERLKQEAENELADKKAQEEAAKQKQEKEEEDKRIAAQNRKHKKEVTTIKNLINKIQEIEKNTNKFGIPILIGDFNEIIEECDLLRNRNLKMTEDNYKNEISKIKTLIENISTEMKNPGVNLEDALNEVLKAEEAKKPLELKPALKVLKDKLNGLKINLKNLKDELTILMNAFNVAVI